jgi:hypothetical protein
MMAITQAEIAAKLKMSPDQIARGQTIIMQQMHEDRRRRLRDGAEMENPIDEIL